jgi:hypothetical protein
MVERIMVNYRGAFTQGFDEIREVEEPEPVRRVLKKAATASWKSLAAEDLEGTSPTLPLGKYFWPSLSGRNATSKDWWRIKKCTV